MKKPVRKLRRIIAVLTALFLCVEVCVTETFAVSMREVSEHANDGQDMVNDISGESTKKSTEEAISAEMSDGGLVSSIYETSAYSVISTITSRWEGGFNASVVIKNTGKQEIRNWYLQFSMEMRVTNFWNAVLENYENSVYVLKNAGWNSVILPGDSVEFGYSSNVDFVAFPDSYQILGSVVAQDEEAYKIEYKVDEYWNDGFKGALVLTNRGNSTLEDWAIEFDFENAISSLWNGEIIHHEGCHYVVRNAGYNSTINSGESVSFGFLVSNGDKNQSIQNSALFSFSLETHKETIIEEIIEEQDPLLDLSENYVKASHLEDVIFDENTGKYYINNQILVSTYLGVPKDLMIQIADEIDADVVGYIEILGEFQLQFRAQKSCDDLMQMVDYFTSFPFVEYSGLNTATPIQAQFFSNDSLYDSGEPLWVSRWIDSNGDGEFTDNEIVNDKTGHNDGWGKYVVGGNNWGLEALDVHLAWEYKDRFQGPVKVGIFDNMFGCNEDISYAGVISNPSLIDNAHGTHVAGTIGATFNNHKGVSGVATDVKLYGYSVVGNERNRVEDQASTKAIFSKLIENEVRVNNVSYGYKDELTLAATNDIGSARKIIKDEADALTVALAKLIKQGYDFLIVVSAGNGYAGDYVENFTDKKNAPYGYEVYDSKELRHVGLKHVTGFGDTVYGYHLTFIGSDIDEEGEDDLVKKRIMVVGAVEQTAANDYQEASFSNEGNRVDTYAPGVRILSTIPQNIITDEYRTMDGTSQAAPHISGIAALMLQANPTLRAEQIKRIIMECKGEQVKTYDYTTSISNPVPKGIVYMPNAEECVATALEMAGGHSLYDEHFPIGTVKGKVVTESGEELEGIQVTLVRKSIGDANLKDYYFTEITNNHGEFVIDIPQGTYDMIISGATIAEGTVLPYKTSNIEVEADTIKYLQTSVVVFLNTWEEITGTCNVEGRVFNALTGKTVAGAVVRARVGWDNYNGPYVSQRLLGDSKTVSDANGDFSLKLSRGQYTIEVEKKGFILGFFNVSALKQNDTARQSVVITPVINEDEYRIVLVWGTLPRDSDSHLTYYKNGTKSMHVYYKDKKGYINGEVGASLDLDDTFSYGPETITIKKKIEEGEIFYFSVHNYIEEANATSTSLSDMSQAAVRVFHGNDPVKTFFIPTGKKGTVWRVFSIDKNGVKAINSFYSSNPGGVK